MKFFVSFILVVTTLPLLVLGVSSQGLNCYTDDMFYEDSSHVYAPPLLLQQATDRLGKGKGSLKQEFKERHKNKAAVAASSTTNDSKTGNIRKPSKSNGGNAAASRLDLEQMEKIANRMKGQLAKDASGEVKLKDKQKERIDTFMKRYEARKSGASSGGRAKQTKSNELDNSNNNVNAGQTKENRHSREFKETKGLFLGKTKEEREDLADHIRMELMEHEANVMIMPNGLYQIKKKALARYDRINHPEMAKTEERTSWYNQMKEKGVSAEPWTLEEKKSYRASEITKQSLMASDGTGKEPLTGNGSN